MDRATLDRLRAKGFEFDSRYDELADIDVYGTKRSKLSSNTTPKLLMFFRSEDQANGLPKEDPNPKGTLTFLSTTINDIAEDKKYDQSFGFDLYREKLVGNNTKIFKINEDKNGDYILNGSVYLESDTGITLEMLYDKTPLFLELIDGKKTYYISEEFNLKKGNSILNDKTYYAPNILIKQGKEVKISIKFFDTDSSSKLGQVVTFKLSNSKGIDSFTQSYTFNKNEEIAEFKIKTKPNEMIDTKATVSAFVKDVSGNDIEIGRITVLPNKLYEPKIIFVDVFYKKNTLTSNANYNSLANDINNKAFNQASINFVLGKNQILNVTDTDFPLDEPLNNIGQWLVQKSGTQVYEVTQDKSLDNALDTITSKFFERIAQEILEKIEKSMQELDIKDGTATNKLVPLDKTLKEWFYDYSLTPDADTDTLQWYDKLLKSLYDYADQMKLGIYPIFICNNITTKPNTPAAVGFMRAKGLIIPSDTISDTMSIIHELGHNLGLRHPFDIPGDALGDIKLKPMDTFENIMDYLSKKNPPVNYSKNFLTYQIDRMRENMDRLKCNIEDMNYKIEEDQKLLENVIKDFEKNIYISTFSYNLCNYLIKVYQAKYTSADYLKLISYRDKILIRCVDIVKTYFNNL